MPKIGEQERKTIFVNIAKRSLRVLAVSLKFVRSVGLYHGFAEKQNSRRN
jgi:hypothetical protein